MLRKRKATDTSVISLKRQHITLESFFPEVDISLRINKSMDILGIVKQAFCFFNQNTIAQESSRPYKSSNNLLVDSKPNMNVPRESVYDAEMYRILFNWLTKVYHYEIIGQWHLEQVGEDGGHHHLYCDLTIKKKEDSNPIAILELVWLIHFSREDDITKKPYWPSEELQKRGLNVIHFWHDKGFKNAFMSARVKDISVCPGCEQKHSEGHVFGIVGHCKNAS
ncbi:20567_t:CDS:2 [Racocetra persica]|uniref:20567_t:CDS:1 n=1 Tax=Racocetra persica TaxID=160502 RepID=A0ACA9K972_9GLOM|nr:20567_t:CDS:2 [Racocetra persica]